MLKVLLDRSLWLIDRIKTVSEPFLIRSTRGNASNKHPPFTAITTLLRSMYHGHDQILYGKSIVWYAATCVARIAQRARKIKYLEQ